MTDNPEAIALLNALGETELHEALERCCGAARWARAVATMRPFENAAALYEASSSAFEALERADWLEAFSHHPQIGDIESLRAKFATTREWAGAEQAGTSIASEVTLQALARGNEEYLQKFGYIFIICATGKSADEMLTALRARLPNAPDVELLIASRQQAAITLLRLEKLLAASA